jgi:hypothetical protein
MYVSSEILEVKIGQDCGGEEFAVCPKDGLDKFVFCNNEIKTSAILYQTIERSVAQSRRLRFQHLTTNSKDRYIFYRIFYSNKNNFLMMKVSFVIATIFLLGLILVLISSYDQVILHQSGFIVLSYWGHGKLGRCVIQLSKFLNHTLATHNQA